MVVKKVFIGIILLTGMVVLAACGSNSASGSKKEIKIGATAGPYSDQVTNSIKPILEKEGYDVKVIEFSDYVQPNKALHEGDLDANVFQNVLYMEKFNEEHDMDLVNLLSVPTAPIGVYSEQHKDLSDIQKGAKVTLPNDPVNMARALIMMDEYGWIALDGDVDPSKASEKDVAENKLDLNIAPLEAAQLPRSLGDSDFAFINGNFALASGIELESALGLEETPIQYMNQVVINSKDKKEPFVKALEDAYKSKEFIQYTDENLAGFVRPEYFAEIEAKK
ncbi:MetQ/NlpA family ABC transporter substrate-binding protein [Siminovitchia terrae]|uniref:MetQ/NlpA family ABC transporter substrate-binding protein n=1 Tax=Siminovitchia terrae TaxID=1914933 RepID=UPI0028AFD2AD|nr:MetQ/NlpA family ABC transporter substrate-binding protein [Siminovitchia terrae]